MINQNKIQQSWFGNFHRPFFPKEEKKGDATNKIREDDVKT